MEDKKKSTSGADVIKAVERLRKNLEGSYIPTYFIYDNIIGKINYFSEKEPKDGR